MNYLAAVEWREQQQTGYPALCKLHERDIEQATTLLNLIGARIVIFAAGDEATGVWSDLDSAEVRLAIRTVGRSELPVVYLDSPRCPSYYKVRSVPGQAVPLSILAAMEAAESEPWLVRDKVLRAVHGSSMSIPLEE